MERAGGLVTVPVRRLGYEDEADDSYASTSNYANASFWGENVITVQI